MQKYTIYYYLFLIEVKKMKLKKVPILLLLCALFITSAAPTNADLSGDNVHSSPLVAQQAWFTKLIKLDKFKKKDISGTLNFKLVPDKNANAKYYPKNKKDPNNPQDYIEIVPGAVEYSYKLPFSSKDYADPKFTELARESGMSNGDSEELLNHALLHEWGRLNTSDHGCTFCVGKLFPEQYESYVPDWYETKERARQAYEEQKEIIRQEKEDGAIISWAGDPDTEDVVGWKKSQEGPWHDDNPLYDFLGSYEEGAQNLKEYSAFLNGTLNVVELFTFHVNRAVTYVLTMTTRPIAIEKKYDAQGNISSIEKPLLSCTEAFRLHKRQKAQLIGKYGEDEYGNYIINKVFRYKLKEYPSEGIKLDVTDKELIVDVVAGNSRVPKAVYMFEDEASADEFYKEIASRNNSLRWGVIDDNTKGAKIHKSDRVQLVNGVDTTEVPVRKVWKDSNNKYKDRSKTVTAKLYADGKDTGKSLVLSKKNKWKDKFVNLPAKKTGKKIKYTVKEKKVKNYTIKITGNSKDGFVLTNTHQNKTPKDKKSKNKKAGYTRHNNQNPSTGDTETGIMLMALLALASGGVLVALKKKKSDS